MVERLRKLPIEGLAEMRFREFKVDRHGPWKGLRLSGMSAGMNVAFVPDPADRRALFGFIRFVLSGLAGPPRYTAESIHPSPCVGERHDLETPGGVVRTEAKSQQCRNHADGSARHGDLEDSAGSIVLAEEGAAFRLYRSATVNSAGLRVPGELVITTTKGDAYRNSPWSQMLERVSPETFLHVVLPSSERSLGRSSAENAHRIGLFREQIRLLRQRRCQLRGQLHELTSSPVHVHAKRLRGLVDQEATLFQTQVALLRIESQIDRLESGTASNRNERSAESSDRNPNGRLPNETPMPPWLGGCGPSGVVCDTALPSSVSAGQALTSDALWRCAESLVAAGRRYRQLRHEQQLSERSVEPPTSSPSPDRPPAEPTEDSLREANRRVSLLRRQVELDRHIEQMRQSSQLLEAECRNLMRQQSLPVWLYCVLAAVFVIGLVLVLVGITAFHAQVNWLCIGVGLTMSLASALAKISFHRLSSDRLTSSQRQLQVLKGQIANSLQERDSASCQLTPSDETPDAQLKTAEVELANLEKAVRRGITSNAAPAQERQQTPCADARAEYHAARRRWREALSRLGLPRDLTPGMVKAAVRPAAAGDNPTSPRPRIQRQQLAGLKAERQRLSDTIAAWRDQARQRLAESGREISEETVGGIVEQLRCVLRARSRMRRQRRELIKREAALRHQVIRTVRAARRERDSLRQTRVDERRRLQEQIGQISGRRQAGVSASRLVDRSSRRHVTGKRADEALVAASVCLDQLSEGQFVRLEFESSRSGIRVRDKQGRSTPLDGLRPIDTRLVHLSLRLAQVERMAAEGVCCPFFVDGELLAAKDRRAAVIEAVLLDFSLRGHQVIIVVAAEDLLTRLESLQLPSARLDVRRDGASDVSFRVRLPKEPSEKTDASLIFDQIHGRLDEHTGATDPSGYQVLGPISLPRDAVKRPAETGNNDAVDSPVPPPRRGDPTHRATTACSPRLTSPQSNRFFVATTVAGDPHTDAKDDPQRIDEPDAERSHDARPHDIGGGRSEDLPDWWPD